MQTMNKLNKTENAFSPTLPEMLFDRKKNHKILQNTNAEVVANAMLVQCLCNASTVIQNMRNWEERYRRMTRQRGKLKKWGMQDQEAG